MHPSAVAALALEPSGACQTYKSPTQPPGTWRVGGCRPGQPSLVFHQGVAGAFAQGFGLFSSVIGVGTSQDLDY